MSELGKAYVQIVPSADGISGSISKVLAPEATAAGSTAGTKVSQSMGSRISSISGKFIKAGAVATAISLPIIAGIKKALTAYETQATAETKLTEIYKTRMGASKKSAKATMDYASALQKTGVIGDEVTLSGAQQLATFAKYPGTVDKLLPAMGNLLAQQKGVNASTGDAVNIGNLMGKVMQGQTGALKRVGISFSAAEEKVLKYGTEQEKAAMLAKVITQNVGNMNEELAKTPAGKIQQLKNSMGDLTEDIGAVLAPALSKVAQYLSDHLVPALQNIVGFMQAHPIIGKIAVALTGILAIGGPLLVLIGTVMAAVTALSLPVLGIVAGIGAVIAIGVVLMANWKKISAYASKVWTNIKTAITSRITAAKTKVLSTVQGIKDGFTNKISSLRTNITNAFSKIKDKIVSPIQSAKEKLSGIVSKITGLFPIRFGRILHFSLPKIDIDGGQAPWGIGGKGRKPSFKVSWASHAAGGIFDRSTLLASRNGALHQVGEAGPEAILPLNMLWSRLDSMADSIVSGIATVNAASAVGAGGQEIVLYAFPNGPEMYRWVVNTYDTGKKRLG